MGKKISDGFCLILFLVCSALSAEEFRARLPAEEGKDLPRGSILSCRMLSDNSGLLFLIRQWDGPFTILVTDFQGDIAENISLQKGNYYGLLEKDGLVTVLSVPERVSEKPLEEINIRTGEIVKRWPWPEIVSLYLKKGGSPEDMEAYFRYSPSGDYLLIEVWIRSGRIRTEETYYDRQAALFFRGSETPVRNLFFNAEDCFTGETEPRYFPCVQTVYNNTEEKLLLAGPVQPPAVYLLKGSNGQSPEKILELRQTEGEFRYLFFENSDDILQYDHYANRCRLFDGRTGELKGRKKTGLRYPYIIPGDNGLLTVQDDGLWFFSLEEELPGKKEFIRYNKYLRNSYFVFFKEDSSVLVVPYSYADGVIRFKILPFPQ